MRRRTPRRTTVAALAACLALLAGCGDAGSPPPTTTTAAPEPTNGSTTTGAGSGGLGAYYRQRLQWTPCGNDQCASLRVPVDYAHPAAASVQLAVEKAAATSGRPIGALVVNPGGPGAAGVELASHARDYFAEPLRAAYDIVGFDPRGTGASDPVDCLSDSQLDAYVAQEPVPSTPAQVRQYAAESRLYWQGCRTRSDALVGHVSTVDAARDMDLLRAALGQPKLDYLGFSYGTKLGATYAQLFGRRVGRMVLDGAEDPNLSSRESSLHQAAGFETALRSYVTDCVAKGSCFLGATVAQGLARISGLLDAIVAHPLPAKGGRSLEAGNAFYGVVAPLYSRRLWPVLDQALQHALQGDGSILMLLSDSYTMRTAQGGYGDNSMEAIGVIGCEDDPSSVPPSKVSAQYAAFTRASPTFGKAFAWGLAACWGSPFAPTDDPGIRIDRAGVGPIVVVGTTRDPATPYEEAVALSKELRHGVLITRDGDGHTGYNEGNACVDDAVHGYLIDGRVPRADLHC